MKQNANILQRLAEKSELVGELMPGLPLIEIAGENRVLIENHLGVKEYGQERIGVKVKFGMVLVIGRGLELCRMSKEQLVISGRIDAVTLQRRKE